MPIKQSINLMGTLALPILQANPSWAARLCVFYSYSIDRMFSTLRKFLVIFLTMLQFIAPLVHAHASEHSSRQGLHVPGLEHYGAGHIAQVEVLQCNVSMDGMIVGVDTGIKQNRTNPQTGSDNNYYLHQQTATFNTAVSRLDTTVSPQPQQMVYRLFAPSHSPRAPPAQSVS